MTKTSAKTVTERGQSKPPSHDLAQFINLVNETEDVARIRAWLHDTTQNPPINTLKDNVKEFLGPTIDLRQFQQNCWLLDTANVVLNQIADQGGLDGDGSGALSLPVNLYAKDDGTIGASGTFLNVLIGAKADRLRKCAICKHIFWARRSNSQCCGLACRKRWNQQNSRENRRFKKRVGKKGR